MIHSAPLFGLFSLGHDAAEVEANGGDGLGDTISIYICHKYSKKRTGWVLICMNRLAIHPTRVTRLLPRGRK